VLEFSFLRALHDVPRADVVAALLVFRLFYLVGPFVFSIFVAAWFERRTLLGLFRRGLGTAS
jgi:glycosyltransferase 2 family protein